MGFSILSKLALAGFCLAVSMTFATSSSYAAPANELILIEGEDNTLNIETESDNSLTLAIDGRLNGGFGETWTQSPIFDDMPAPGTIVQTGFGNALDLAILGTRNLFSVLQSGQNNTVNGFISGTNNAASVSQVGSYNVASFSQIGTRNSLAISQTSW